ncbi:MAG TPA: GTP-binding protein, partial [Allosphingosinicella sp.]
MTEKSLLRIVMCGSVDDGKSSLLGRLLLETGSAFEDEIEAVGDDLSLLVDGLEAERAQGITIDVAYRFFATATRKYIVADAPGHEQYTRNLVTGASNADAALVLVDATRGVLTQTRRHAFLARLLGARHLILAVNKMDLVGHDQGAFEAIRSAFGGVEGSFTAIPLSAVTGANVTRRSDAMPWYDGPSLIELLEAVPPQDEAVAEAPFRMPVQWVIRGDGTRCFAGMVASGHVAAGDEVRVMPAGTPATVDRVAVGDVTQYFGLAGQSVAISLRSQVDCSRGDVLAAAESPPEVADQFEAAIVWMGDEDLVPGRQYGLKLATQYALATVQPPKHEIDVDTMEHVAARTLAKNGIGIADLWTDRPLV